MGFQYWTDRVCLVGNFTVVTVVYNFLPLRKKLKKFSWIHRITFFLFLFLFFIIYHLFRRKSWHRNVLPAWCHRCISLFQAPERRHPTHSHRSSAQRHLVLLLVSLATGKDFCRRQKPSAAAVLGDMAQNQIRWLMDFFLNIVHLNVFLKLVHFCTISVKSAMASGVPFGVNVH